MKAWCCIFATFLSRRTLCATYFPNLRRKLFSYFFRKKFIEIVTEKFCVIFENQIEMKVKFKHLGIFFLVLITLQSCKPDDLYYDLSDDAKGFLLFEIDDTFKLKNLETNEIITLKITSKEIRHYEDGPNESSFISFGPSADVYIERGEYTFTDDTNCYDGIVAVEANRDGGFELKAFLGNCFGNIDYSFDYQDEFFTTIDVEGIEYSNAYLLRSFPDILFYSKEKGILKIVDDYNHETRFTIVE